MQSHVHARTNRRTVLIIAMVGLRIGEMAPMQVGETVVKIVAWCRRALRAGCDCQGKSSPGDVVGRTGPEIGPGTKAATHAGQHDDAHVGIVIARSHAFPDLCDDAALLGGSNEGVHPLRTV